MAIRCHELGDITGRLPRYAAAKATVLFNPHRKPVNGSRVVPLGVTYNSHIPWRGSECYALRQRAIRALGRGSARMVLRDRPLHGKHLRKL